MSQEKSQVQNITIEKFFEQLTWTSLEKRVRAALKNPHDAVPLEIHCPAVRDLAKQILSGIGESAIQRPGKPVSEDETFKYDQRLAVLRIMEAIICEYEKWRLSDVKYEVVQVRPVKFEDRLEDLRDKP